MTKRQAEILKIIEKFIKKNGYSPSFRELGKLSGIKSTAQIHGILKSLREQGKIKYIEKRARTLEVI